MKSRADVIRWIKNRGRGRPPADKLKQAKKILGGKRAYDRLVKDIKEGNVSAAPKKSPGRPKKSTGRPRGRPRKSTSPSPFSLMFAPPPKSKPRHTGRKKSTYRPSEAPPPKPPQTRKRTTRQPDAYARLSRTNLDDILKTDNIKKMFDILNSYYFQDRLSATISWKKIRGKWGLYSTLKNHIYIATALKKAPSQVIAATVYHEMLHEDIPVRINNNGCRVVHGSDFKRREKLFPWYSEAKAWKKRNTTRELSAATSMYGVKVGETVTTVGGLQLEIIGFDTRAWKFPIKARTLDGQKIYKVRPDQILRKNPTSCQVCPIDDYEIWGHRDDVVRNPKAVCPLDEHEISGHENDVIF